MSMISGEELAERIRRVHKGGLSGPVGALALERALRDEIEAGRLECDATFSINAVAKALGMSRRYAEAAARRLEEAGYVDIQHGRSTRVVTCDVSYLPVKEDRDPPIWLDPETQQAHGGDFIKRVYKDVRSKVLDFERHQPLPENDEHRPAVQKALGAVNVPQRGVSVDKDGFLRMCRARFVPPKEGEVWLLLVVEYVYVPTATTYRGTTIADLIAAQRESFDADGGLFRLYQSAGLSLVAGKQQLGARALPEAAHAWLRGRLAEGRLPPEQGGFSVALPTPGEPMLVLSQGTWAKQVSLPLQFSVAYIAATAGVVRGQLLSPNG